MYSATFIRHAQSTYNASGDTSKNVPITAYGKQLSSQVKGNYDVVICSTLKRARETLSHSSITTQSVLYIDACREIRDGNPSNLLESEPMSEVYETEENVAKRINTLKTLIRSLYDAGLKNIGVVSHGIFLSKMIDVKLPNCWQVTYKFD